MFTLQGLAKRFGSHTLFEDVSMRLIAPHHYGLIGANGSGKSTFLKVLTGEESASDGTISLPKRVRIGTLRQDRAARDDERILDAAMQGDEEVFRAIKEREKLLAAGEAIDANRLGTLEETIEHGGGWALAARAAEVLEGLGIPSARHDDEVGSLSGGYKLRVLLAAALLSRPDALLLDEPTNHLDILSIRWLERFLLGFDGMVAVVSHDHRFLDNICDRILDVDYATITEYSGGISFFEQRKVEDHARRQTEIDKRKKEIAEHKKFIERFSAKATKARQAQSRVKQMEKIEIVELVPSSRRHPLFRFQPTRQSGREVLHLRHLSHAYDENVVLEDVDLLVRRGDRLAIIGENGIGKSTLIKIAAGVFPPTAGEADWGHETHVGYFPQEHREVLGHVGTVLSAAQAAKPAGGPSEIRGALGRVLFSDDDVNSPLPSISGGEAARVLFCRLMLEQPNVLLLDEPTNHLDFEAIHALIEMLQTYPGTVLFVSHDRFFVSEVATRILELRRDGRTDFGGTFAEYLAACGDDHLDVDSVAAKAKAGNEKGASTGAAARQAQKERQRAKKKLEKERDSLLERIEVAEARGAEIDALFCRAGFFDDTPRDEIDALQTEQSDLHSELETKMSRWETVEVELADLEQLESDDA